MKINQVAAQLFTVRNFCKTAPDYAASLDKLAGIGYQAIQISGVGPIPVQELKSIADDHGMTICVTHEPGDKILDEPADIAERIVALGAKHTAFPHPGGVDFSDPVQVEKMLNGLTAAHAVMAQAGVTLSYHNHALEFHRQHGGQTVYEMIWEQTPLGMELDTFWVQAGGADPVDWCQRLKGRLPLIHLKDYAVNARGERYDAEIGAGNLRWPQIIAAAEASGCQWFIVEQDSASACGDPFEALGRSFHYIKTLLCK